MKKNKVRSIYINNAIDKQYILDNADDSEEDNQKDNRNVEVSKKQYRPWRGPGTTPKRLSLFWVGPFDHHIPWSSLGLWPSLHLRFTHSDIFSLRL
ncbi:hypothetical protein L1987_57083 [Smallanthus sonchifolius]|uniref:Uncharacterized protein n=1 Tax=Smallanthus sonchifolius TaxID=185202 RepID=A0ACB9DCL5_9ASTR|nr:hypothetical protein L1987_57083 [Smallanthus sonchifolius]